MDIFIFLHINSGYRTFKSPLLPVMQNVMQPVSLLKLLSPHPSSKIVPYFILRVLMTVSG